MKAKEIDNTNINEDGAVKIKTPESVEKTKKIKRKFPKKLRSHKKGKPDLKLLKNRLANFFENIFYSMIDILKFSKNNVEKNIRIKMILAFGICMLLSLSIFYAASTSLARLDLDIYMDYSQSVKLIEEKAEGIVKYLEEKQSTFDVENIKKIVESEISNKTTEPVYYITDLEGRIQITNDTVFTEKLNIHSLMKEASKVKNSENSSGISTRIFPMSIEGKNIYFVYRDVATPVERYMRVGNSSGTIAFALATITFILTFFLITKNTVRYIENLSDGLRNIAQGDLNYKVVERGEDELFQLARNINNMSKSLKVQIESERKSEKSKQELITNVSHDLRSPLTSILGYLRLVKDNNYEDKAQLEEYVQIVYSKAEQLKSLIDDLFEYTKISYQGVQMTIQRISFNELVDQSLEEFIPLFEENNLQLQRTFPEEEYLLNIDPNKTHRVIENLISNAIRYSKKPSMVKVIIRKEEENVLLIIENQGERMTRFELDKIFERFYRKDEARNLESGGSGLGLAIAKGIVEIQGGRIWAECEEETIRFNVSFPL